MRSSGDITFITTFRRSAEPAPALLYFRVQHYFTILSKRRVPVQKHRVSNLRITGSSLGIQPLFKGVGGSGQRPVSKISLKSLSKNLSLILLIDSEHAFQKQVGIIDYAALAIREDKGRISAGSDYRLHRAHLLCEALNKAVDH